MKRILYIFLAVQMLFLAACNSGSDLDTTQQLEENADTFFQSEDVTTSVVTPYCALRYPSKWENVVEITVLETETLYSVSYYAEFDSAQIPLFTISIGENHEGFELGTIETSDGIKTVYMDDYTHEYDGSLSAEDEACYMEMCEDVNVIISNLVYDCGMQLP